MAQLQDVTYLHSWIYLMINCFIIPNNHLSNSMHVSKMKLSSSTIGKIVVWWLKNRSYTPIFNTHFYMKKYVINPCWILFCIMRTTTNFIYMSIYLLGLRNLCINLLISCEHVSVVQYAVAIYLHIQNWKIKLDEVLMRN